MRHVQQRIVGVERRAEVVISGKLMTMMMTEHRDTSAARTSQRRRNNVKIISDVSRLASSSQVTRLSPQPMHQNRAAAQGHLLATSSLAIAVRQRSPAVSNATEGRSAKLLGARKRFSTTRTSK